jgi:16S rRNA (cytosine967-C5)-methyltransferase
VIAPARLAAYRTLRAVEAGSADLADALARARTSLEDERDRALAGEIAIGTLRWQGAFDHVISSFAGRPLARLDLEVLTILRMSMFQLLHLDRVPAAAVVDEGVQLARLAGKSSAAGFVNALLRRVSRERGRLPLPPEPASPRSTDAAADYLATTLSHPRWLVARWLGRHGYDAAAAWARFDNAPAPLTLRANTLSTGREALARRLRDAGVETEPARFAGDALVVRSGNPLLTPFAREGCFAVQDEASQLVGSFVEARPGEVIFDACASPGGKTIQMAAGVGDAGTVVAADIRGRRLDLLTRTVKDAKAQRVRIVRADARAALPFADAAFDAVLVDAPCSGLGTIRRDPDIRWRRSETDLAKLAVDQGRMLDRAALIVKPGGRLVYATCSSEPEENEQVVDAFLSRHADFAVVEPEAFSGSAILAATLDERGFLRTLPFRHGLEAFFAARLVKARDLR